MPFISYTEHRPSIEQLPHTPSGPVIPHIELRTCLSSAVSNRAEKDTENCFIIFQELIYEASSYPIEIISKVLDAISASEKKSS